MEYRFDTRISYLYSFSLFESGYLAPEGRFGRPLPGPFPSAWPRMTRLPGRTRSSGT